MMNITFGELMFFFEALLSGLSKFVKNREGGGGGGGGETEERYKK